MSNETRSSQSFCARPGCGIARTLHGYSATACSRFVAPGTKEANALKRAHLTVVNTPVPELVEDDPTAKVGHITDAQLMAEWRARAEKLGVAL